MPVGGDRLLAKALFVFCPRLNRIIGLPLATVDRLIL
jgi:hypothetical protein